MSGHRDAPIAPSLSCHRRPRGRHLARRRADVRVTHKTVSWVVDRAEAAVQRATRRRSFGGVRALVATKTEHTTKRLLPEAKAAGYEGSDRNLRRLVA